MTGRCDLVSCYGCTDSMGCNYDAAATLDDGGCDFVSCYGCMDAEACNYDATATFDDGSCDFVTCVGCTYPGACNFSAEATEDDGSCDFSCLLTGCTDPNAVNHFAAALSDDGSCLYVGCMDPNGLDYDPTANYPGGCDYPDPCPGDFTGNGVVDINDLLDFFQLWDVCELTEEEIKPAVPAKVRARAIATQATQPGPAATLGITKATTTRRVDRGAVLVRGEFAGPSVWQRGRHPKHRKRRRLAGAERLAWCTGVVERRG